MGKTSDAQIRAVRKYDANNTVRYTFKCNNNTDADIIEKLNQVDAKQTYIKKLIREDIAKTKSDLST